MTEEAVLPDKLCQIPRKLTPVYISRTSIEAYLEKLQTLGSLLPHTTDSSDFLF